MSQETGSITLNSMREAQHPTLHRPTRPQSAHTKSAERECYPGYAAPAKQICAPFYFKTSASWLAVS
jgi:hypothetical protein